MRRLRFQRRRDRGAVAVFVALSMVALLGFTALGVDGGALWSDHKQLQNGADAGALAIAQACALGDCGDYGTTATQYAVDNKFDTLATGAVTNLNTAGATVTVQDSSTRRLWFAPVIGVDTATIRASATAGWASISGGSFLPLAISLCAFYAQSSAIVGNPIPTNTPMDIYYATPLSAGLTISQDPSGICGSGAGSTPPGGFNWVGNQYHDCTADVTVGDWITSQPGNVPKGCSFGSSLHGQTLQIPVFDATRSQGSNGEYHIYAIASFLVEDYCFHPGDSYSPSGKCTGSSSGHYLSGYFVSFTFLGGSSQSSPGAPNLGTNQVLLTN